MNTETDYLAINRQSWNNRTETHLASSFYDIEGFLKGGNSLNEIELNLLGDISNKTVLHLQCHFGQDTVSLQRLGAVVTGVDLSDKSIECAIELSKKAQSETTFICCDIYDLPKHLDKEFDIVFTSYGTVGWLPDMDKWGKIVAKYLKPGGLFVFADFHPVVWMFDNDFKTVGYNYFNTGAIIETESGTYADRDAAITQAYVMWNHGISEVVNGLISNGLTLQSLQEYDHSPYNCFNGATEAAPKKFRIQHLGNKIPMVYSIVARK